ncbi:RsmB/NOP family class I SAM-dependent RNA methyltransferase [Microbacterium excoecariae]|uniref:RsmB/NOP family class I SAM-dependent RNA methyltransferase n=1 Tax=Microbacterium excoecariae TaxID=2715210 RepID=UPI00140C1EDE|nr:transcription antitermination factor NusB [Microbacterium excoecariae]NHI17103.1 rRNA small subunit methyltransferase B [Microbacterium excoecariae]
MSGRERAPRSRRGPDRRPQPVQPAREVAYRVLRAVDEDDAYANLLLPREIERAGLGPADAGLATELTYGTLRGLGTYDAVVRIAAERDPATIDPAVLDAIRLGVHQLLATRVPSHAAVNESVSLAERAAGRGAAGFANAVLRRVSREGADAWRERLAQDARSDDEALAATSSHPVWVIRAFRRALQAEGRAHELAALLEADNAAPRVTMAALPGLADPPEPRTTYSPVGFRPGVGDPEPIVAGSRGAMRVQDEGSQLVALALSRLESSDSAQGEAWLDLCAGPGGKTALLAADARAAGARLSANEVVPARAGLVRRALAAIPDPIEVHERDGRDLTAARPGAFDRILVDAPCTGLGALRRRPEARWRKSPEDVAELTPLQADLLDGAIGATRAGGTVAYVTCSPHLAETVGVVREVLERRGDAVDLLDAPAALQAVAQRELDLPARSDGLTVAQLWPHRHGTDAMFLALLRVRG